MRADFQIELLCLGTIFRLGLGTIASMEPRQKWQIPSGFSDSERWIRTFGPSPKATRQQFRHGPLGLLYRCVRIGCGSGIGIGDRDRAETGAAELAQGK
jgi:hypothetical protein